MVAKALKGIGVKHWRLTLVLLVVLAGLLAYVLVYERGEVHEGPLALRFDADEVREIRIEDPAGTEVRLTRKGKAWRLTKPVAARADKEIVGRFLDDLERLGDEGEIGQDVKDLKPYGLDKPRTTLNLVRRGKPRLTLLFGGKTPDDVNVYTMLRGGARVFMVSGQIPERVGRGASEFRDKTVLPFSTAGVERMGLVQPQGRIEAKREGESDWRLTEPIETDGDDLALDDVLSAAHDLKAAEFVADKPGDLAGFGLDKPRFEVRLWSKGRRKARTIAFGKEAPAGRVYVRTSEEPTVYSVAQADLEKLDKPAGDLRSKQVLAFDHDSATRIRLKSATQEVQLAREGSADERRWQIIKPSRVAADERTVDDVLYALSGLRADEFIDKPRTLADYALDKPRLEAAVTISGRKAPLRLLVGKSSSGEPGVFVKRADAPTVYRVAWTIVYELRPDPQRFRTRQVLKVDRDDIERIVLSHGKTRVVIERRGKDRWQITSPRKVEADPGKLAAILFTLEDLRGDELVASAPADLAPYGLDKPDLTAEVTVKGRRQPERVLIGKAALEDRKVYLKRESAKEVYLKDRYALDDLRKDVDDLKK